MLHGRKDFQRIQDPAGKIPADEPVFLLLGRDIAAHKAVRSYAQLADLAGAQPEFVRQAMDQADRMEAYAKDHGAIPDMPWPNVEPEPADRPPTPEGQTTPPPESQATPPTPENQN